MFSNVLDMLQISCRYRLLDFCALIWTDLLRWNLFATGNRGGNVAVRRRWTRQLPDVGQFGFVSGPTACPSARERARIVQATLCVAASEVNPAVNENHKRWGSIDLEWTGNGSSESHDDDDWTETDWLAVVTRRTVVHRIYRRRRRRNQGVEWQRYRREGRRTSGKGAGCSIWTKPSINFAER